MNEIELCLLYMTLMLEMNFGSIWIGNTRDQIQFNNVSQNPHSILFVSDSYKQCFVMDFLFSHEHCIVQICSFFFGGNTVFGAFLMDPISIYELHIKYICTCRRALCVPLWIVGCVFYLSYILSRGGERWKLISFILLFLRGSLKSPWSRRRKKHALLPKQWKSFFTPDGKLTDGGVKFLKKVRSGVCYWLLSYLFSLLLPMMALVLIDFSAATVGY